MKENIITGKSIFTNRSLKIGINKGIISSVEKIENCEQFISPGFFDIQINGYNTKDYSSDLSSDQIKNLVNEISTSGTTTHFPTIITNSETQIITSIKNIVDSRKKSSLIMNAIPGIHIEGPFISPVEGARGCHDPNYIRQSDFEEFLRWQDAAEGLIKLVTVSPEDDRAISFIEKLSNYGVIAAIGHTDSSTDLIQRAIDAGARLSTHLGNGCKGYVPRLENHIWKQLSDDRLFASFISDGFHLPPYVLNCFTRCKGIDKSILVSDIAALAGNQPGIYKWGKMDIKVYEDGHLGLNKTNNLAGASQFLDKCIDYLVSNTNFSLRESITCATVNPAKLIGLECWDDEPIVGSRANIISFKMLEGSIRINKVINFDRELYNEKKGTNVIVRSG